MTIRITDIINPAIINLIAKRSCSVTADMAETAKGNTILAVIMVI
jgi:hypothetical protein